MPSKRRYVCQLCSKSTTTLNALRHARNRHVLCPYCGRLASRVKHACFGLKLLSRSQLFKTAEQLIEGTPIISNIFVPIEIRADCGVALRAILAARELLDTDVFSPALFMLAKLRRTCLGCLSPHFAPLTSTTVNSPLDLPSFHTCLASVDSCVDTFCDLACNLFNVQNTDLIKDYFKDFLKDHSFA